MLNILTMWCTRHIRDQEVRDQILSALRLSLERSERFLALIGRALTTDNKPYLVQRFGAHLFMNELTDDIASGYDLHGSRLRCGSFPEVRGFERRPQDAALYKIERFDGQVTRTGITQRRVTCNIAWHSAGVVLGGGMGLLFTSNYGGNDAGLLIQLAPEQALTTGGLTINLDLEGLELVDRGVSLFVEIVQLGGFGILPSVVSQPVLSVLCV